MSLNEFINSAIVGCIIFLTLLCLLKKTNTPIGYRFLSLLLILLALVFVSDILENSLLLSRHPGLAILFEPVLFAFPPTIYFAVKHLTEVDRRISFRMWIHFIPYALIVSLYVISFTTTAGTENDTSAEGENRTLEFLLIGLFAAQILVYLTLSLSRLRAHRARLPYFVATLSGNDFRWLYNILLGLCVMVTVVLLEFLFQEIHVVFYFSFIYLAGFYYIGIQIAQQKDVLLSPEQMNLVVVESERKALHDHQQLSFADKPIDEAMEKRENDDTVAAPRKQVITDDKLAQYKSQLLDLMENKKPYLDSEITLALLSKMLQLNTYQTSYLINTCFGENFYVFINRYRVEECKKMLLDSRNDHLSILGIAFDSGFNSKTAFNTSFKKSTGVSPKEYREQNTKRPD